MKATCLLCGFETADLDVFDKHKATAHPGGDNRVPPDYWEDHFDDCPRCGAMRGTPCTTPGGANVGGPHARRPRITTPDGAP